MKTYKMKGMSKEEKEMSNFHDWYFRNGDVPSKNKNDCGFNEMNFGDLKIRFVFWFWRKFIK